MGSAPFRLRGGIVGEGCDENFGVYRRTCQYLNTDEDTWKQTRDIGVDDEEDLDLGAGDDERHPVAPGSGCFGSSRLTLPEFCVCIYIYIHAWNLMVYSNTTTTTTTTLVLLAMVLVGRASRAHRGA